MPTATKDITQTAIRPRFLYNTSIFDGATITSNSEVSTLPATNLQDPVVRRSWRTLGTTQLAWVVFDVGTTVTVNMAAIFGHNLTSVAAVTLQGNASDSWGSPSFAVGLTIPADADGTLFEKAVTFAQGTYRYWRLAVTGVSDGTFWQIGRFVAGSYFQPSAPHDIRVERSVVDPSLFDKVDGQQVYSRARDIYYRYMINIQNMQQGDRDTFLAMFRSKGQRLPFAMAFDPTNSHRYNRDTIYGRLTTDINEALIQMEYGTARLTFDEVW